MLHSNRCYLHHPTVIIQSLNRYYNDLGETITFIKPSFPFNRKQVFQPGRKDHIHHTEGGGWIRISYNNKECDIFVPAAINTVIDPLPLSELFLRNIRREGLSSCLATLVHSTEVLEGLARQYFLDAKRAFASGCAY